MKAYEDKIVFESNLIHDAVFVAHANINKKKSAKQIKLWKKRTNVKITQEIRENDLSIIEQTNRDDPDWVKKIYANAFGGGLNG